MELGSTVEALNSAETKDEAFSIFCAAMKSYGYEKVTYTLCTDHPSLGLAKQHGLSTSYPDDWMKEYQSKNFFRADPVIKECMRGLTPFLWDDMMAREYADDKDHVAWQIIQNAEDAGVADGIGISFVSPYGELSGLGVARTHREKERVDYDTLARIHFLSAYFHEAYRELTLKPETINLTEKEQEVLCWAVEGKTDDDIATLMNISFHTVRFHWRNIFKKLNVFNKIHAVTKALRLKLILPGSITY